MIVAGIWSKYAGVTFLFMKHTLTQGLLPSEQLSHSVMSPDHIVGFHVEEIADFHVSCL